MQQQHSLLSFRATTLLVVLWSNKHCVCFFSLRSEVAWNCHDEFLFTKHVFVDIERELGYDASKRKAHSLSCMCRYLDYLCGMYVFNIWYLVYKEGEGGGWGSIMLDQVIRGPSFPKCWGKAKIGWRMLLEGCHNKNITYMNNKYAFNIYL